MSMREAALLTAALLAGACATRPVTPALPGLGTPLAAADVAAYDISIPPSGAGLPAGGGDARDGAKVYQAKCANCHGAKAAGKPADALAGGIGSLKTATPQRTVGSYWPHATTLFDYTRRAMPVDKPLSLSSDEVYAVTAYVLFVNGIVAEDARMDAQTLPRVRMPNRDGFIDASRGEPAR